MRTVFLTLLLISLLPQNIFAQTAKSNSAREPAKAATRAVDEQTTIFEVFQLRHATSNEVAIMLRELVRGADLIPDLRTNSVLVNGTAGQMDLVRKLVKQIDQPFEKPDDTNVTKIFRLQSDANEVYSTLRVMTPDKVLLVADIQSNSLIATGSMTQLGEIAALVEALDIKPAAQKPLQLRVIWLSSDAESSTKADSRLASVMTSLERVGINDLAKKAQLLVNVSEPNCDFSIGGSVGANTSIQVHGERIGEGTSPTRLDIMIQVKSGQSPLDIEATVTISPEQMVVLGATPSSESQSVFVVELIEGI